jgi:SET domain-containing protein
MLLVKTYLDRSPIHGIGIFAAEPVARGTVIWRLHPAIDVQLTADQLEVLAPPAREQLEKYTYLDPVLRTYVLCGDDARFFNHSDDPNCIDTPDQRGGKTVAARDIAVGEELTCDYASIDMAYASRRGHR